MSDPAAHDAMPLRSLRIKIFQTILLVAAIGLGLICMRTFLIDDHFAVIDFMCLVAMVAIYVTIKYYPGWFHFLIWAAYLALLGNVLDGMNGLFEGAITPTHILLPALVIYGALMGEMRVAITGLITVLVIYFITAQMHGALSRTDSMLLSNLAILSVILGLSAYLVWRQHAQLAITIAIRIRIIP